MAYYHDYLAVEFGGYPHEDGIIDLLWERSPIRYAGKVTTPTMLVHGENDNDVPIAEAEQFYIALHDVGVEAVMVRYPREGHGIRETRAPGGPARALDCVVRAALCARGNLHRLPLAAKRGSFDRLDPGAERGLGGRAGASGRRRCASLARPARPS